MKQLSILAPKYIWTGKEFLENFAIAFGDRILDIDEVDKILQKYPNGSIEEIPKYSFVMAGLINSHVHLEYSHHTTQYSYGSYIGWLNSVVQNFSTLSKSISNSAMEEAINQMVKSGTTSIGAISSMGLDFQVLKNSPIRKIVFNEIIASQPHQVDELYSLWLKRVEESEKLRDRRFTPAVAIHSPFSVHSSAVKRVLKLAKERGYIVSAHFMESKAEREWLDSESGEMKEFYTALYGKAKRWTTAKEFIDLFDGVPTLFTHGIYMNSYELSKCVENSHSLSHCPVSNRLLGGDRLDIDRLDELGILWNTSTDGLSSNVSLNLFDEMRSALFLHNRRDLESFAIQLFKSVTQIPAKQLGINSGEIAIGKDSDMIVIDLENLEFDRVEKIPLHLILRGAKVVRSYIFGERV